MDMYLEILDVIFMVVLSSWIFIDIVVHKASTSSDHVRERKALAKGFASLTIALNAAISVSYLGFGLYDYEHYRNDNNWVAFRRLAASFATWFLATSVSLYSRNRTAWPRVLILWWIVDSLSLSIFVISHFKTPHTGDWPYFLPRQNAGDLVSFPLSLSLCLNAFGCVKSLRNDSELKRSLLDENGGESDGERACFASSGIWSKVTFRWLNPLFETGRVKKLELGDIPSVPRSETAGEASAALEESLRKQKFEEPSLAKAILAATWKSLAGNAVFAGINTAASYAGPLLITSFVNYLLEKRESPSPGRGIVIAFGFFLSKTAESLTQRQWYFGAHRIGVRVRAALTVMIYNKSVSTKFSGAGNGKIVNLINVDAERIGDFCWYVHGVWLLPVQVFLALAILYANLGALPALAALVATATVMVSNTPLAGKQERLHSKIMEARDSRIKATSETLKSMRVLKLHSWEPRFLEKILRLRDTERGWLGRYLYTCSAVAFLFWASPTLVSVATFGVCVVLGTPLTAGTVLSALATFRILQEPIYNLPELVSMITQTKVSLDRIHEFVKEDTKTKSAPYRRPPAALQPDIAVEIGKAEFAWDASDRISSKRPTVKIAEEVKIMKGWKVAVCGSVGSGKSSLLCGLIGEIPRVSRAGVKVNGSRAYVPQSAWIQTGTVRENVLFGKALEQERYERVLEACALDRDIKVWQGGDLSVVGERGMNLSGGQKQRIQLARAVYSDSDVYFLDDPFSAVDAHTGTHLFKKCLLKLLSEKTVVYATHQLEFLEAADLVLVMKDGRIAQSGRYQDLISDLGGELISQMNAHRKSLTHVNTCQQDNSFAGAVPSRKNQIEVVEDWFREPEIANSNAEKSQEEEAETGRVKWSVYSTFITSAYGGALVPVILSCQVIFQGLQMGSNYWIAWATEKPGRVSNKQLLGIFVLLSGGSSVFILGRAVLMATIAIETAQRLFRGMIESVFRAPISFFDSTPSSRILNRSSTDQSTVDTDIPYRLAGLAFALIQLLSIIVLMSQVAWQVFLLFFAVLGISIWYQAYYISTARELARMVGIRKSPVLHHFSESITGAATIRCFEQEERFSARVVSLVDDHSRVAFHNSATMEWLSVRINFLFNLVFFLVLIILVTLPSSAIDPSLAGLVATYGLSLNVLQAWVIWNLCNVENKMISVERILQFTSVPSEAPLVIEGSRPSPEWPEEGKIELENLHVQYDPALPMVLKGITCTFPAGKKIGIVGRTGSGKSTLIQALFRVVEPWAGRIMIDGVDVAKLGLQDLRSRLGIIPQDPTLFQGTVRTNLDPLQEHSDHEIWEVLNKCRLADIVRQDQRLLDAPVAEDGENWSVGQRQLVCLARVLLKRRRILVLDEATASIDTATDNVIQETIREETNRCTVITVAHRIPTVIDNDLVLVLDDGKIVEYDSPTRLLEDSSSSFSKLVAEFLRRSSATNCCDDRS